MGIKEVFKPRKFSIILTIIILLLITQTKVYPLWEGCLDCNVGCYEGKVNIRVPPNYPGSKCCQICVSDASEINLNRFYYSRFINGLPSIILGSIVSYVLLSIAYYSYLEKKKKKS